MSFLPSIEQVTIINNIKGEEISYKRGEKPKRDLAIEGIETHRF
jgi:hypothetical protein